MDESDRMLDRNELIGWIRDRANDYRVIGRTGLAVRRSCFEAQAAALDAIADELQTHIDGPTWRRRLDRGDPAVVHAGVPLGHPVK